MGHHVIHEIQGHPARLARAMASAATAMCTPASSWWMILTVLPWPGSLPTR
jgi:hypothetical protein